MEIRKLRVFSDRSFVSSFRGVYTGGLMGRVVGKKGWRATARWGVGAIGGGGVNSAAGVVNL